MPLSRCVAGMLSTGLMVSCAGIVSGQDYPNKPIRIVTAAAGGGSDFDARQVAGISGSLGQPVVIDNRTGPLAAEIVSKAPPDGYTLVVTGGALLTTPLLQKVSYDILRDFLPITQIERTVSVVAVHPSVPAKSIKELIALAKARPGALNYSSAAIGGPSHLGGELFKSMAGVNIVHIPYKGGAPAMTALLAGEVHLSFPDAGAALVHVKSGKLRALAVTSAQPSELVPGLPTVAASGLPGYEMVGMTGIYAPIRTSSAIINRLNQEIVRFLSRVDVKERFLSYGVEVVVGSPEQFAATLKSEVAKWEKVIKDAGIKLDQADGTPPK